MDGVWLWSGIAVLALVVIAVDRLVAFVGARRDREGPRPRTPWPHGGTSGPGLGEVIEIFQPTARYRADHRSRELSCVRG